MLGGYNKVNFSPYQGQSKFQQVNNSQYQNHNNMLYSQVDNNIRASNAVTELEMILEGERRKAREIKLKIEQELEGERKVRIDYENKFIHLKDETLKREMLISELDFKVNNLAQENQSLKSENFSLKEQLSRMQDAFNQKIHELEEKIDYQQIQGQNMQEQFRSQMERMNNQYQNEYENLCKDSDMKLRVMDEKYTKLMQLKKQLEIDLKQQQDNMMRLKMQSEEEFRELQIRIQEEEYRKYISNIKMLESKLIASEEQRQGLMKKNSELLREIQSKDRQLNEQYLEMQNMNTQLNQELSDLKNHYNQADVMIGKLRAELANKDQSIARIEAEFAEMDKNVKKEKEYLKHDYENQIQSLLNEKRYLDDIKDQQARKIAEMENQMNHKDRELSQIRFEYDRLCNQLKDNIQRTITSTYNDLLQGQSHVHGGNTNLGSLHQTHHFKGDFAQHNNSINNQIPSQGSRINLKY